MDKNYKNWLKEKFGVKGALSDDEIEALAIQMEEENFDPSEHQLGKLGVFDLIESIATLCQGKGAPRHQILDPMTLHYCGELGNRLEITPLQALLMSAFVNFYPSCNIEIKDLAEDYFQCTNLNVLTCFDDIKVLIEKKYILERTGNKGISYLIPLNTVMALRENRAIRPRDYSNLTEEDLFQEIEQAIIAHNSAEIDYDELCRTCTDIVKSNPQLTFCRQINGYRLDKDAWVLLLSVCSHYVEEQENLLDADSIQMLLPTRIAMRILHQLHRNTHPLLTQNILEPAGGTLARDGEWSLSHSAAKELLGDLCPEVDQMSKKGIISAHTIGAKSLFYPTKTARQISELENLLMPEKFTRVQDSLVAHGMRKGFACLFYGAPGTGKTETVLQLARKTGRAIMQVDMSEMRDKFVGESEKNVKAIFMRYRRLCSESDLTPILLLNEADALLSVRLTSVEHSVDQMENAMQNIILQEMENLDGILIATTNLTQNLDAAFDRRFLYKVEFKKPTAEESRYIWQAMLPNLDEANARSLASQYDFSGGQIENIARKQVVSNILRDSEALDMSLIREACDAERLNRHNAPVRIAGLC